jgi:hypothetical protein
MSRYEFWELVLLAIAAAFMLWLLPGCAAAAQYG